jgi:UDP-glucose 4-epimerase
MKKLEKDESSNVYNLGSGVGFSVLEIIEAAREVTSHQIPVVISKRRSGDPARLIASSLKAEKELGWVKKYTDVKDIISSAWKFHQLHKDGFNNEN